MSDERRTSPRDLIYLLPTVAFWVLFALGVAVWAWLILEAKR